MYRRFQLTLAAIIAVAAQSAASAQPVVIRHINSSGVEVSRTPGASNAPLTISVAGWGAGDLLQVFHQGDTSLPANSIGIITITGVSAGQLSVVIGGSEATNTFPQPATLPFNSAAFNVAGLAFDAPQQQAQTRASISVTGSIAGPVAAARFFRLDAATNITGSVTATSSAVAILQLRVGNKLSGAIIATSGSIDTIVIGPSPTAEGITGDITAVNGSIRTILTTGQIGRPDLPGQPGTGIISKIWAGHGIGELRAGDEADPQAAPLAVNFRADIDARLSANHASANQVADGSIDSIQTGGDYTGSIRCSSIFQDRSQHAGILVTGVLDAPINVDLVVSGADIIASTILKPIVIGVNLRGSVIATDPVSGAIEGLDVGHSTAADANTVAASFARGVQGSLISPTETDDPLRFHDPSLWFTLPPVRGSIGSLIRARSIGTVSLRAMFICRDDEKIPPRIEAEAIKHCFIGELRSGVVWSGKVEFSQAPGLPIDNSPANDFAGVQSDLVIGCIGRSGRVWFTGCPFALFGPVYGELSVDHLLNAQRVRIGDELGSALENPGGASCAPAAGSGLFCNAAFLDFSDGTPRSSALLSRAIVRIRDVGGLEGQVIINANQSILPREVGWRGEVVVGEAGDAAVKLAPDLDGALQAPSYEIASAALGGGAIGAAPFHLYQADCFPPNDSTGAGGLNGSGGISELALNGTHTGTTEIPGQTILARFYGPIRKQPTTVIASQPWSRHVKLLMRPFPPNPTCPMMSTDPCVWMDVSNAFTVLGPGEGNWPDRRSIGLKARNGNHVSPGIYMLTPVEPDSIECADEVTGHPPVVWPTYCNADDPGAIGYGFVVWSDCDADGLHDQYDCNLNGQGCTTPLNCQAADFNHSGLITVQDIFDFLVAYFAGDPTADVNGASGVTVQDIFDYLSMYFTCPRG